MRRKISVIILCLALILSVFAGCTSKNEQAPEQPKTEEIPTEGPQEEPQEEPQDEIEKTNVDINIAAMKGPTGLGAVNLMSESDEGKTANNYNFTLEGDPTMITGKVINGEIDIAALPVNVASILYNKTEGEIQLLGVNALGVVYILTNGEDVSSLEDLKGKTIHATGQGATPEYVFRYVLENAGIDPDNDLTIQFEPEAAALQTQLAEGDIKIAMLPEPFVSAVTAKNPDIQVSLDLTQLWEEATGGEVLTTGGILVRKEFLENQPEAVAVFMQEYENSVNLANSDIDNTAKLAVEYGIIGSEEVAKSAIPRSNITLLKGEEMKEAVLKYYEILLESNPQSIGGTVPNEDFFYQS